jgi:phosphate transport system protein
MLRQLHVQLDRIRERLIGMGGLVEDMVGTALRALLERDERLAQEVLRQDKDVDRLEVEIDEACHSTLALTQPTARDLRFLVAVMKITGDLERMGDSAVNIVQSSLRLVGEPPLEEYLDLPRMAGMVQRMVREALDAFVARDVAAATAVCRADDDVDDLYRSLFQELMGFMKRDPGTVDRALHLLLIARNLERIADHATNIAEDVVYLVEARDIRHSQPADEAPAG